MNTSVPLVGRSLTLAACVLPGALILAAIAPWLNPCIGPIRFIDCVDFEQSAVPNALAPWLFCPLGICDYFPSAADRAVRGAAVLLLIVGVGIVASRKVSSSRFVFGLAASVATCLLSAILIGLLYVRPGA